MHVSGLLYIEDISVSRIKSPFERLSIGQNIDVMVKDIDTENNRISFSMKELFGTWEDNIKGFKQGTTVKGIVRETEKCYTFYRIKRCLMIGKIIEINNNTAIIELTIDITKQPNLVGLAEYK